MIPPVFSDVYVKIMSGAYGYHGSCRIFPRSKKRKLAK